MSKYCEIGMITNSEISIISLYGESNNNINNYRIFSIIPKCKDIKIIYDKVDIILDHGIIITMCGDTQIKFMHGIEKSNINTISRISLSFRQFKE